MGCGRLEGKPEGAPEGKLVGSVATLVTAEEPSAGAATAMHEVVLERVFKMRSFKLTSGDGEGGEDELEEVHHLCCGVDWKVMRECVRRGV